MRQNHSKKGQRAQTFGSKSPRNLLRHTCRRHYASRVYVGAVGQKDQLCELLLHNRHRHAGAAASCGAQATSGNDVTSTRRAAATNTAVGNGFSIQAVGVGGGAAVARVRGGLLWSAAADDATATATATATGASYTSVSSTKRLLRRIGLVRPAALASEGKNG